MDMTRSTLPFSAKLLNYYYAATIVFVLLDYLLNINVRVAFLQDWPAWRAFYYVFCFACFGLMLWRPGWSTWIATFESLLTLSLLILNMGVRVILVTDEMIETGRGGVTTSEIINFMIVSIAAYLSYMRGATVIVGKTKQL
jgi:hypothetical protein